MPKVSVIMPVYNSGEYLNECVDSIIQQTFTDWELLCVDDASTDESLTILSAYVNKDVRIKVLQQEHRGAGAARNLGLKNALGEYLLFLDSDDFFEPNLIEDVYSRAKEKEADIVIYHVRQFDNASRKLIECNWAFQDSFYPFDVFSYKDNPQKIFNAFQLCPWNKMFRRQFVIDNNIEWQEITHTNDFYFCCKALMCAQRITLVKEKLVNYRVNLENNLQSTNHEAPLDFYKALQKVYEYLRATNRLEEVKESFFNRALRVCLYNLDANPKTDAKAYIYEFLKFQGFAAIGLQDYICENPEKMVEFKKYEKLINSDILGYLPQTISLQQSNNKLQTENQKLKHEIFALQKEGLKQSQTVTKLQDSNKKQHNEILRLQAESKKLYSNNSKLRKNYRDISNSLSFRLGRVITYIPRKIRDLLK